jgi:hypothetical protein
LCMLNSQNRSHQFPKPVEPVFFNISLQNRSHRFTKPIQPVFFSSSLQRPKMQRKCTNSPLTGGIGSRDAMQLFSTNISPLPMHKSRLKFGKDATRASHVYKIHHKMLHMSKWPS